MSAECSGLGGILTNSRRERVRLLFKDVFSSFDVKNGVSRVWSLRLQFPGLKVQVSGFGFWISGLGLRVSVSGFKGAGFGFRALGFGVGARPPT